MPSIFQVLKSKTTFYLYCLIITLLVILPINSSKELNNITILHFRADYLFHALLFIPWAFFNRSLEKRLWFWLLLGLVFASVSEFLQFFLPYRSYNINDLLANTIGLILGFLLWNLFRRFVIFKS